MCTLIIILRFKFLWLQSEDDEPAVKISSVIAVLSLKMQPGSHASTDHAKRITGA